MPVLEPQQAPPPDYYAANLLDVVAHIQRYQYSLLSERGRHLLGTLQQLGDDALRLFARLLARTTVVIRCDSLAYNEVGDTPAALTELANSGLITRQPRVPADALLARLKVAELRALFADLPGIELPRRATKATLVATLLSAVDDDDLCAHAAQGFDWLCLAQTSAMDELRLVYFGDERRDLTEFIVRDLGITSFEPYDFDAASRAFADSAEQSRYRELTRLSRLPRVRRGPALKWLLQACADDRYSARTLARRRDRLLIHWGRDFERDTADRLAIDCYQAAHLHPAREREVRTRKRRGEDVSALLTRLREQPRCAEERVFAERFERRSVATWPETQWRSLTPRVERVEQRVANLLTANGGGAWHVENALFPTLLALAFWDVLFMPIEGMFTHPFQRGPRDLFWPDFRQRRASAIDARLAELRRPGVLWSAVGNTAVDKWGTSCALVHWRRDLPELLNAASRSMAPDALIDAFDLMLDDLAQARSGLPDLLVCYPSTDDATPDRYELVEVKGPGDTLQPNQRVWLERLVELGIPCRVVRLRYYKPIRRKPSA